MSNSLAKVFFLTFSTYGTRLLGDKRGSTRWDGTKIAPSSRLERYMDNQLVDSRFRLSPNARAATHDVICCNGASHRFYIDALNVRTNHVHAVVCAFDGRNVEEIVTIIKIGAARAIRARLDGFEECKLWTKSFGVEELHHVGAWRSCVRYTLFSQGSNAYMSLTQFSKLRGMQFDERGEPTADSLLDAFHFHTNALYRANLFNQQ